MGIAERCEMRIVGLMLARDESWVLPASIDAALRWVDRLVFMHHGLVDDSTFATIMAYDHAYKGKMHFDLWSDGDHWLEMDARQKSLEIGRSLGGTHFAIIDADEILTANLTSSVRHWFDVLQPGQCLDLPMIAPWKSLDVYSPHTQGVITLGFADAPHLAWRPRGEEKYHYHARAPQGETGMRITPLRNQDQGGVFHLQYASEKRLVWKHRHYMMSERVRWNYPVEEINRKYHWWTVPPHGTDLKPIPAEWWGDYPKASITLDHEPWHAQACREMWRKYGAGTFQGLDLFGWAGGE